MKRQSWLWPSVLFCNEFTRAALYYVWFPLILPHRLHISIGWLGFCTSCQFAADALTKVFYGVAASRGRARVMLRGGTAVSGVSAIGLLFTHNPLMLLVLSTLFGCGAAAVWPAALTHYSRLTEESKGESMAQAFAPWMAGTGVGMFLPNILLHHRANPLYAGFIIAVVVVFCGVCLLRPVERVGTPSMRRELQLIRILSRKAKVFLPPMLLQTLVIGIMSPFFALFAVKSLHLHPFQYAILLIGIGTMTVLLLIPFGKVSDRMGRLPLLALAFSTCSISILALSACHTWGQALVAAAIFGAGFGAVFPAWNVLFLNAVPHWLHSRAVGLFTAIEDSGTVLGPFIGALAWQFIGTSGPFMLAGIVMAFLAVYFFVWWRRTV